MQDLSIKLAPARGHLEAGRHEQATALLQRVVQQHPGHLEALGLLIRSLASGGRGAQASYYIDVARRSAAGDARLLLWLGHLLAQAGLGERALGVYEEVLAIEPGNADARVGVSGLHCHANRLGEAIATCRAGLEFEPDHPMLLSNLGVALLQSGRAREAVEVLRRGAREHPDHEMLVSTAAAATNYAGDVTREESFAAHRAYDALLNRQLATPARPRPVDPDPERRLRVGIVSADLRAHPCGSFIEPWLAGHSEKFAITCYSVAAREDGASARLRKHPVGWKQVAGLHAKALADLIREDRTDVVLELSGLTAGHRLIALHLRPAPVQVTYLGYPNTTGLSAMDARLVDSITDPEEPGYDAAASERLVRMDPCFLCFPPIAGAPEPGALPALEAGRITFGSFNNIAKLDEATVELWSRAVLGVPGSRLLLKYHAMSESSVREGILERFAAAGLGGDRVVLDPPGKSTLETLAAYQRVDIGLDTFPYHGTTTTCEALFMGVPVVTRMGNRCVARVSGSILAAAGIDGCTATTDDEFVAIAGRLAGDLEGLAARRAGMRAAVLGSVLCDQGAFVARLEGALRMLWREACAG